MEWLGWAIAAVALFSFMAVSSWAEARRKEREAYYRSEAVKKVAEMQNPTAEQVQMVRDALEPETNPLKSLMWMPTGAQKAYYRSEMIKRIAAAQNAGADSAVAMLREDDKTRARRFREGLKIAGLLAIAVGIGVAVFLYATVKDMPFYLAGLSSVLVGVALLLYAYVLAPKLD